VSFQVQKQNSWQNSDWKVLHTLGLEAPSDLPVLREVLAYQCS